MKIINASERLKETKGAKIVIAGESGVGKTMFGLTLAGAIATNNGFLEMPSVGGARPVLYVEGELPASDIQIRINGMLKTIDRDYDPKMFFVSSHGAIPLIFFWLG